MYLSKISCIGLFLLELPLIITFGTFCLLSSVFGKQAAAFGAGLGEGFKIGGEVAIRPVATAVKGAFLLVYFLYQVTITLGAADTNLNLKRPGIFVLGVMAAGEELAVTPGLDY